VLCGLEEKLKRSERQGERKEKGVQKGGKSVNDNRLSSLGLWRRSRGGKKGKGVAGRCTAPRVAMAGLKDVV